MGPHYAERRQSLGRQKLYFSNLDMKGNPTANFKVEDAQKLMSGYC